MSTCITDKIQNVLVFVSRSRVNDTKEEKYGLNAPIYHKIKSASSYFRWPKTP